MEPLLVAMAYQCMTQTLSATPQGSLLKDPLLIAPLPLNRYSTKPNETGTNVTQTLTKEVVTFETFCADSYGQIANALGWTLGNHALGKEAADEAYTRAFERWDKVSCLSNPSGWVYKVGLNWARRRVWRHKKEAELLQTNFSQEKTQTTISSSQAKSGVTDPDLYVALTKLSLKNRSAVVLRHLLGYSEKDTAAALEISIGTVKSRTNRGLKEIRETLDKNPKI